MMLDQLLKRKTLLNTLLVGVVLGGILSYMRMGKLEDAEVAIKSAVVITQYPGATAHEVELEVTDVLEKAIQKMENIDDIESRSISGYSEITVNIDEKIPTRKMPQMWDYLRRKVNDVKASLPAGAREPVVNDDFGDVYGIFAAVSGEGYTYNELYDYADLIRRELLEIKGIKRVELFGNLLEAVDINISAEELADLSINPIYIVNALQDHGQVVDPGSILSGTERVRLTVGSKYSSIEEIKNILVQVPQGGNFRLADIADIKRTFYEPRQEGLLFNGKRAISLAMSMESSVNVIEVGEIFDQHLMELEAKLPAGIEVHSIFSQPERVQYAIGGFIENLIQSVLIVIVVLLFATGIRSGLLIASGLLFTILGTFIVMALFDIQLQRISLAAIIVAMGMLVDNSIVVADGILVGLKNKQDQSKVFTATVKQMALPLLGATVIAILAFMPLALSPDSTGEYLSSLFSVLAISLFLSWTFAMIQTPYMASLFYRKGKLENKKKKSTEPYNTPFYRVFKKMVGWVLWHKTVFLIISLAVLVTSILSFRFVRFEFMPVLDYNQFFVEYKLPRGTDVSAVEEDLKIISEELTSWDDVINVTAAVGRTPARYTLIRFINNGGANYGELIVDVEDYEASIVVGEKITNYLEMNFPEAQVRKKKYAPIFSEYEVEVQFSGPDPAVLRDLARQAKKIMHNEPTATSITDNWKNKVKVMTPEYLVEQASKVAVSRSDVARAIAVATNGLPVGQLYEGEDNLLVQLKLKTTIGEEIDKVDNIPVWAQHGQHSVPLAKVTEHAKVRWEENEIFRYNGQRAIRVQCDPIPGVLTVDLEEKLKPAIDAIALPLGYSRDWKGTGEDDQKSQKNLFSNLPMAMGLMLIIVIALFNNIKQASIIFMILPFVVIGIVVGFVSTGGVFNFVGIIGALGLIGMMTKNSIVLLDEINLNIKSGQPRYEAILSAAVSRMLPVLLASATTMLGMLPLLFDVMFKSMAITIIFGLLFGTVITLFVVPVLYAVLFRVNTAELSKK